MLEWGLAVVLGLLAAMWWLLARAPVVDEGRCVHPVLLDPDGTCPGPCAMPPPCTRED